MLELIQSKNIYDYSVVLEGLLEDFSYVYTYTMLQWCDVVSYPLDDSYWQVYLIKKDGELVGVCGLYSLTPDTKDELWLGWFGIIPEHRSSGIGAVVLADLEGKAKADGAKVIYSYVDVEGKPLKFYERNGYTRISTVGEYLSANKKFKFDPNNFENLEDHVIRKFL